MGFQNCFSILLLLVDSISKFQNLKTDDETPVHMDLGMRIVCNY